jgi:bifunctional DNA-binding transcriptional regulator/antitoxin component of YhaV-PrlF toxin-antitoxin module
MQFTQPDYDFSIQTKSNNTLSLSQRALDELDIDVGDKVTAMATRGYLVVQKGELTSDDGSDIMTAVLTARANGGVSIPARVLAAFGAEPLDILNVKVLADNAGLWVMKGLATGESCRAFMSVVSRGKVDADKEYENILRGRIERRKPVRVIK